MITIDTEEFKHHADTGRMEFHLASTGFILEMESGIWVNEGVKELFDGENGTTIERDMAPIYQYNGRIENKPASKVRFTMDNQTVLGSIDANNDRYIIEQVGWVMDNETQKTVYVAYKKSDLKSIIRSDTIRQKSEPLFFTVSNLDEYPHQIVVEVFDSSGVSIFIDEYALDSGQYTRSPSIIDETNDGDTYVYKATLENNITGTYNFTVDADSAVDIDIVNDSDSGEAYFNFQYFANFE